MAAGPTLYHVPRTISSPIYQTLLHLNLSQTIQVETLTFADLKTHAHLTRNPMGTSPAFTDEHEGIAIWESGAVLSYILQVYDTTYELHPNPQSCSKMELAKFLHLQQFIIATVYPFVASLYIHTLKPVEEQDEKYIQAAKEKFITLLAPTLMTFLHSEQDDGPFFFSKISAIDYLVAKPLNNAKDLGLLDSFPELENLLERIQSLPSFAVAYNIQNDDHVKAITVGSSVENNKAVEKKEDETRSSIPDSPTRSFILVPESDSFD